MEQIYFKTVETRRLCRVEIETGAEEMVTVSNRNNLPLKRHLELLNLNDDKYEYRECN